jgi:hypothetical protein
MAKEFELQQLQQQQLQQMQQSGHNPTLPGYPGSSREAEAAYYSSILQSAGLYQPPNPVNSRSPANLSNPQQPPTDIRQLSPFLMAAAAAQGHHIEPTSQSGKSNDRSSNRPPSSQPQVQNQMSGFPGGMSIEYMNQMMLAGFNPMAGLMGGHEPSQQQAAARHTQSSPHMNQQQQQQQFMQQYQNQYQMPGQKGPAQTQQQLSKPDQSQLIQQQQQQQQKVQHFQQQQMQPLDQNYHTGFTEFQDISRIMWSGSFMIKNDVATIAMNFVSGNVDIGRSCLNQMSIDNQSAPLRILQRMRLEQSQLEGVQRKLQSENEHCILIAVPYGMNSLEQMTQTACLRNGFINYLLEKRAAGIINVAVPTVSFYNLQDTKKK